MKVLLLLQAVLAEEEAGEAEELITQEELELLVKDMLAEA